MEGGSRRELASRRESQRQVAEKDQLPERPRVHPQGVGRVCQSPETRRGVTEMDRLVTERDEPEVGGNREAVIKDERTRKGEGQAGHCELEAEPTAAGAKWQKCEDKDTEATGFLSWPQSWPFLLGLPTGHHSLVPRNPGHRLT